MTKVVKAVGYVLMAAAIGYHLIRVAVLWYRGGFWAIWDALDGDPYDVIQYLRFVIPFLPGIVCLWWADRQERLALDGRIKKANDVFE